MMCKQTFHYFAYGSNLLKQRIQLRNPSAVFLGFGLLSGYTLKFVGRGNLWGGAVATIEPNRGNEVYGAVWTLDVADLPSLDAQEAVPRMYTPKEVTNVLCRVYQANDTNTGLPSPYYLDVILRGAAQCSLPSTYIERLRLIRHNGYLADCAIYSAVLEQLTKEEREHFQVGDLKAIYQKEKLPEE